MKVAVLLILVFIASMVAALQHDVSGLYICSGSCVKGQGGASNPNHLPPSINSVPDLLINISFVNGSDPNKSPLYQMNLAIPSKNFTEIEYGALVGNVMRTATFSSMGVPDLPAIEEYVFDFAKKPLSANKVVRHLQNEGLLFVCNFYCERQEEY